MITEAELDLRLIAWARDYTSGRHEQLGYAGNNLIATLIDHKGFVPDSRGFIPIPTRTATDEIEGIVQRMEQSDDMGKAGRCVRVEYFKASLPEDQKLWELRKVGVYMSRTSYYEAIKRAKCFLIGYLSQEKKELRPDVKPLISVSVES